MLKEQLQNKSMIRNYLFAIFFIITSCNEFSNKWGKDARDPLTIKRKNITSNKLKLNGYYYCIDTIKSLYDRSINEYYLAYDCILLNKNGVCVFTNSIKYKSLDSLHIRLKEFNTNDEYYKNFIYTWGVFQITNSTIEYQRWFPKEFQKPLYTIQAEIVNDSTFITKKIYLAKDPLNKIEDYNRVYHFKHLAFKPDSVNTKFVP
jgi:hypothetical protein